MVWLALRPALYTWSRRAFTAIERLKQIAGAHTAAIPRIACCVLRHSVQAFWSREPLAAMQPHFPQKSEADNRQQRFVHSLAAGVQPMFERTDEMRADAPCGLRRLGASLHRCCAACVATGLNDQVERGSEMEEERGFAPPQLVIVEQVKCSIELVVDRFGVAAIISPWAAQMRAHFVRVGLRLHHTINKVTKGRRVNLRNFVRFECAGAAHSASSVTRATGMLQLQGRLLTCHRWRICL